MTKEAEKREEQADNPKLFNFKATSILAYAENQKNAHANSGSNAANADCRPEKKGCS